MIAAYATIGWEIKERYADICDMNSVPTVDYIFVSVGGGGVIGGISSYFKHVKPSL